MINQQLELLFLGEPSRLQGNYLRRRGTWPDPLWTLIHLIGQDVEVCLPPARKAHLSSPLLSPGYDVRWLRNLCQTTDIPRDLYKSCAEARWNPQLRGRLWSPGNTSAGNSDVPLDCLSRMRDSAGRLRHSARAFAYGAKSFSFGIDRQYQWRWLWAGVVRKTPRARPLPRNPSGLV
ncbi:MAG: hypothetical protein JWR80_7053 [Bradyrhizobium sp.]|nr:hypothetical protein [Bradyrhizobium sp.]